MIEEICHKPLILKDEWRKEVDVGKGRAKAEAARAGFLVGFGVNVFGVGDGTNQHGRQCWIE